MKKRILLNILFVYDIILVLLIVFVLAKTGSLKLTASITSFFLTITTAIALIVLLFFGRIIVLEKFTQKGKKKKKKVGLKKKIEKLRKERIRVKTKK